MLTEFPFNHGDGPIRLTPAVFPCARRLRVLHYSYWYSSGTQRVRLSSQFPSFNLYTVVGLLEQRSRKPFLCRTDCTCIPPPFASVLLHHRPNTRRSFSSVSLEQCPRCCSKVFCLCQRKKERPPLPSQSPASVCQGRAAVGT